MGIRISFNSNKSPSLSKQNSLPKVNLKGNLYNFDQCKKQNRLENAIDFLTIIISLF